MNNTLGTDILRIQQFSLELKGIFRFSDLQIVLKSENLPTLHNRINRLVKCGLLKRFINGIYTTIDYSKEALSACINPNSYLSLGSILANKGLIGTVPEKKIYTIAVGRNRHYTNSELTIEQLGINENLYFGFMEIDGIKYADTEKAYIDTLYYYMKGHRFSFNPTVDVAIDLLDKKRIVSYLNSYKNTRFVKFCKALIHE